jgi:hypothetical protein
MRVIRLAARLRVAIPMAVIPIAGPRPPERRQVEMQALLAAQAEPRPVVMVQVVLTIAVMRAVATRLADSPIPGMALAVMVLAATAPLAMAIPAHPQLLAVMVAMAETEPVAMARAATLLLA